MRHLSLFLLLALAAGCAAPEQPGDGDVLLVPVDADRLEDEIASLGADVVVLNAWATWCGPCRIEMPEFVAFSEDAAADNIAVRFVSMDEPGLRQKAEEVLESYGVKGVSYIRAEDTGIGFLSRLHPQWAGQLPATFVFDGQGELLDFWIGVASYDELRDRTTVHLSRS
jgi:thiol-disulfide isomerase/thioredoxin